MDETITCCVQCAVCGVRCAACGQQLLKVEYMLRDLSFGRPEKKTTSDPVLFNLRLAVTIANENKNNGVEN